MASYDHVKFYDNTQRKQGLTLGGVELVPGLIQISNSSSQSDTNYQKSSAEKHVNIIEYLKTLPKDTRATFVDIKRVLNIDLDIDNDVLDIIKNNPKIDLETAIDGLLSYSYRAKYEIRYNLHLLLLHLSPYSHICYYTQCVVFVYRNRDDLLRMIDRVKTGILVSDIKDCYPHIGNTYLYISFDCVYV